VYVCVYVCECVCECMGACVCACVCVCVCARVCVFMYKYTMCFLCWLLRVLEMHILWYKSNFFVTLCVAVGKYVNS